MHPDLAGLRLRPELLAAGYTDDVLRALRRAGDVATVRPGAYVPGTDERLRDPEDRHALAARAAVAQLPAGAVVTSRRPSSTASTCGGCRSPGCT